EDLGIKSGVRDGLDCLEFVRGDGGDADVHDVDAAGGDEARQLDLLLGRVVDAWRLFAIAQRLVPPHDALGPAPGRGTLDVEVFDQWLAGGPNRGHTE